LSEDSFEEGFGFDGSSIRGWAAINESDMLLVPDPKTALMDPFFTVPTLTLLCEIVDPITRQHYERDPRWIARKAEMYLGTTGLGDTAYFGAEAEFFIFDSIRFDSTHTGLITSTLTKAAGTRGEGVNQATVRAKEGYFGTADGPCRTSAPRWSKDDRATDEHHHEVATAQRNDQRLTR
jgi:glutamine synthetase